MRVSRVAKTIVAVIAATVTVVTAAITDGEVTPTEVVTIALAVLTSLGVYAVPNSKDNVPPTQ